MAELSESDKAVLNCIFNPNLPIGNEEIGLEDVGEMFGNVKQMELEAVQLAEKGDFCKGLRLLNNAIEMAPHKASLFNNRACIYQFEGKFDEALGDVNRAIELAYPMQKKTLSKAYCQRGILQRRIDNLEMAREDFEAAAQLGSVFAKSQLVELNPYTAMCNQMLRKVMDKLQEKKN